MSIGKNEKKPTEKNRIRKQRRDFKLSQREFSLATGIPLGTVRNWEQEKCNPPEYLYGMLYELLRRNSMLNVKTLKVISLLNELAKKENVADGLFCREIDGLFCRSSPDIIVRRRCVLSHKRRGWLEPSPSFRYSRNLALQDELYHPVINNGPAVLVCVDKRLGTGPVNQSRDAG